MIGKFLLRRAIARIALGGLAVGIAALATLTTIASHLIQDTTGQVRAHNVVTARWEAINNGINAEHAALYSYLANNGSPYRRAPLVEKINSVREHFDWLREHGGASEAVPIRMTELEYTHYNDLIRTILAAGQAHESLTGLGDLASQSFALLSQAVNENIERRQGELATFVASVDRRNAMLRAFATVAVSVDILLCLASTFILISYQRRTEQEARNQRYRALHDTLTGLANRQLLSERMDSALAEARRGRTSACLMLVDLDRFKAVNDTWGHHSGDLLLQHVARRLVDVAPRDATVARIGGDEFAVLLPTAGSIAEITKTARRVHGAVRQTMQINGVTVDFGASVGVAVFPADCDDAEGLMRHADMAMYVAKRGGLGVRVYQADESSGPGARAEEEAFGIVPLSPLLPGAHGPGPPSPRSPTTGESLEGLGRQSRNGAWNGAMQPPPHPPRPRS